MYLAELVILLLTIAPTHAEVLKGGQEITVAAVYPKDGPMSNSMCVTSAVVKQAAKNGLKVKLLEIDNNNSVEGTVLAIKKAIAEKVDLVIGTRTTQEALVAADLLEKAKIPFMATMASHPDVTRNRKFVIRNLSNSKRYSLLFSRYLATKVKPKKMVILRNVSLPYSQFYTEETSNNIKKLLPGTQIKIFDIIDGYKDFASLAASIISEKPEVLYLPLYTVQTSELIDKLANGKPNFKILSHGGIADGRGFFINLTTKIPLAELIANDVWEEDHQSPYSSEYEAVLRDSCGNQKSEPRTAIVFDATRFMVDTIKRNPFKRGADLIAVAKRGRFDGVIGLLKFDEEGEPKRALPLLKIKNGRQVSKEILR